MLKKRFFKKANECEVTFELEQVGAEAAALVLEANGWQPIAMTPPKKDGAFKAKVRLPQGSQVQFRYLLDDRKWVNDEAADAYWPNQYGSTNGVVDTTPSEN